MGIIYCGIFRNKRVLDGPVDNFVLNSRTKLNKVGGISSHPDKQVFIFFRFFLGFDQGLFIHHVELGMKHSQRTGGLEKGHEVDYSPFPQ